MRYGNQNVGIGGFSEQTFRRKTFKIISKVMSRNHKTIDYVIFKVWVQTFGSEIYPGPRIGSIKQNSVSSLAGYQSIHIVSFLIKYFSIVAKPLIDLVLLFVVIKKSNTIKLKLNPWYEIDFRKKKSVPIYDILI